MIQTSVRQVTLALALLALPLTAPATASAAPVAQAADGQALTPPMGWNSWNKYHCAITETVVRGVADAIVAANLDDNGYTTVTVDDCWMAPSRAADGSLVADPVKFPSGMKALGDYLHGKGLKFGIYQSPTEKTCQRLPGSYGHEQQDADTFAAWGVDYLKYDWCQTQPSESPTMWADFAGSTEKQIAQALFARMSGALKATGRPITYSLSNCCSALDLPTWAGPISHLWRTSTDIWDGWSSVMYNYERAIGWQAAAGPGGWNDPDMLEVGNGGQTSTEYRSHMSLWAMMAAPLIMGHDVRVMSADTKAILTNAAVLAVDQDPLGVPARRVSNANGLQVLTRPLANGDRAVALLNNSAATATISTTLTAVGLPSASATVTDLWSGAVSTTSSAISASVPSHGTVLLRLRSSAAVTAGATEIVGRGSGLCLDVRGGGAPTDGAPIIIWDCHGRTNQQFTHTGSALATFGGAKCLRPRAGATANGTVVETGTCDGSAAQRFTRTPTGTFRHDASGRCVDVFNAQSTRDTPVILWDCHTGANQQWWRQ